MGPTKNPKLNKINKRSGGTIIWNWRVCLSVEIIRSFTLIYLTLFYPLKKKVNFYLTKI